MLFRERSKHVDYYINELFYGDSVIVTSSMVDF